MGTNWQHNFKTTPIEPTIAFVKVNLENIS